MVDVTGTTILVVEDEVALREFIVDVLRDHQYQVLEASGGNSAFELLQNNNVDLLITDSAMPDGNGFQLIKKLGESGKEVPILVLSGYLSLDESAAKKRGATAYLRKPASADDLLKSVQSLLESRPQKVA